MMKKTMPFIFIVKVMFIGMKTLEIVKI